MTEDMSDLLLPVKWHIQTNRRAAFLMHNHSMLIARVKVYVRSGCVVGYIRYSSPQYSVCRYIEGMDEITTLEGMMNHINQTLKAVAKEVASD